MKPTSYKVGGSVSGLAAGTSVQLAVNDGETVAISADGLFSFPSSLAITAPYTVTVKTQPNASRCVVLPATGSSTGTDVTSIAVTCQRTSYKVGGSVTGLSAGTTLGLAINGGETVTASADGTFTFPTALAITDSYSVAVKSQPTGQTCAATPLTGYSAGGDVNNIAVTCQLNRSVGGTLTGLLAGQTLHLQINDGESQPLTKDGSFKFPTSLAPNSPYSVTVKTLPDLQGCKVTSGTGTVGTADISTVAVSCTTNQFNIGGTATGLNGTAKLTLTNTTTGATDSVTVQKDGSFTFKPVDAGSAYTATLTAYPSSQLCQLANTTGQVTNSNISNLTLTCTTPTYAVSGSVSGLPAGTSLTLSGTNNDTKLIQANGAFTMPTSLAYGASYSVAVSSLPAMPGAACVVSNGSGAMGKAAVTNVQITCSVTQKFAYVANRAPVGSVNIYGLDSSTGTPSLLGTQATPDGAMTVVADPVSGKFLYVSMYSSVQAYAIDPTGTLTAIGNPLATGPETAAAIHPQGNYLFVAGRLANAINVFAIDRTSGVLTPAGTFTSPLMTEPRDISISPDGKFAYVGSWGVACDANAASCTNDNGQRVVVFSINQSTGALTPTGAQGTTDQGTYDVYVEPTGRFVYATAFANDTVSAWSRDAASGELTAAGKASSQAGPITLAADPAGKFLYVGNYSQFFLKYGGPRYSNTITVYSIDQSTGALSPNGSAVPANANIRNIKLDGSGNAYSISHANGELMHWKINTDGTLSLRTTLSAPVAGTASWAMAIVNRNN